ncbi:uncharacterized protein [Porites lutea]|uniref:uncharacterized protein n=1 Tax=Porites lutea TaxID=51062 RepID=UPI003CC66BAC
MKGEKVFCCALLLSACFAFSSGQTTATTPAPTPTQPATTANPANVTNVTNPDTLQCSVYNLTLKLTNATYTDDLANPHSAKFIKLRTDFEVGIMQVYDGYKPFVGVTTLRFSKAPDGKSIVHFCVEFTTNGTHLPNLTKAITLGKLGKLTPVSVAPKLEQAACYKEPAPPVCPIPCPSACAPSCYDTCCQQGYPMGYQQPYYMPPPPPVPVPVPVAGTCPNSCPNTCAPVGCTPACCNTVYNPAPYQYGKRHHAPRPVKGSKKHHIFHKLHRNN